MKVEGWKVGSVGGKGRELRIGEGRAGEQLGVGGTPGEAI